MDVLTDIPRERKPGRALLVLGVVLLVLAALVLIYIFTLGRSPLAGQSSHDFGTILLGQDEATVEHTFVLTNRTGRSIELGRPRPSCGCTVSELSANVLEPGEEVALVAKLRIDRPGRRSSDIAIPIEGHGVRMLNVTGVGRVPREIFGRARIVRLRQHEDAILGFTVDAWPDVWDDITDLPKPTFTAPKGVAATLLTWRLSRHSDGGTPATWNGQIGLRLDAQELPEDAHVSVVLREGQELIVPLLKAATSPW